MAERYSFRLQIGAKRQLTLPVKLLQILSLEEGQQIQIDIDLDGSVSVIPLLTVPRHLVSESVIREMEGRRGAKPSDVSIEELTDALEAQVREPMYGQLPPEESPLPMRVGE